MLFRLERFLPVHLPECLPQPVNPVPSHVGVRRVQVVPFMRIINILEEFIDDFLIWESVLVAELDKACVEVPFSLLSLARSDLITQGGVVLVHLGQGLVALLEL